MWLCLCILFIPSSTAYADSYDVEGYTVSTYYYQYSEADKYFFTDTIVLTDELDSFYVGVDINLSEPLSRNSTFDFTMNLIMNECDVELESIDFYDEGGAYAGSADNFTFVGNCVEALDCTNTQKACDVIRLKFHVMNPIYTQVDSSTYNWSCYIYGPPSTGGQVIKTLTFGTYYSYQIQTTGNGFSIYSNGNLQYTYVYDGSGTFNGVTYEYGDTSGTLGPDWKSVTFRNSSDYRCNINVLETGVSPGGGGDPEQPEEPEEPVYEYHFQVLATYVSVTKVGNDGLLSSIIAWLKKLYDGILSIPSKIIDGLINGIKSLFVPDSQYIVDNQTRWEELLSERFGAVYESVAIIDEWAEAFTYESTQSTLKFPEVKLNFGDTPFTFGGWEIDMVPHGFDFLIDALKMILDIVCTLMFVNGLKHRLEGVLQ